MDSRLDDQQTLKSADPENALGVAAGQHQYFLKSFDASFEPTREVKNIVWAGMGGSALPIVVVQSWPQVNIPLEITRNYDIPAYVNADTLFVASSYSGNTEETLEALSKAEARGAQVVVVAAGGKLATIAQEKNYPLFAIPNGIQPRTATFYFVNAFVALTKNLGITVADTDELASVGQWLESQVAKWSGDVPTDQNYAKQLALQLEGSSIVVYSGPKLFPAANKWKICMNENAKNVAWTNYYPEFNHNEFIGWSSHPSQKPYKVVEIQSSLEHPRIHDRFRVTQQLLDGMRPAPIVVKPEGETLLQQLAWTFALGDFVSIYLAILNGVDPTPVGLVEQLKVELG